MNSTVNKSLRYTSETLECISKGSCDNNQETGDFPRGKLPRKSPQCSRFPEVGWGGLALQLRPALLALLPPICINPEAGVLQVNITRALAAQLAGHAQWAGPVKWQSKALIFSELPSRFRHGPVSTVCASLQPLPWLSCAGPSHYQMPSQPVRCARCFTLRTQPEEERGRARPAGGAAARAGGRPHGPGRGGGVGAGSPARVREGWARRVTGVGSLAVLRGGRPGKEGAVRAAQTASGTGNGDSGAGATALPGWRGAAMGLSSGGRLGDVVIHAAHPPAPCHLSPPPADAASAFLFLLLLEPGVSPHCRLLWAGPDVSRPRGAAPAAAAAAASSNFILVHHRRHEQMSTSGAGASTPGAGPQPQVGPQAGQPAAAPAAWPAPGSARGSATPGRARGGGGRDEARTAAGCGRVGGAGRKL